MLTLWFRHYIDMSLPKKLCRHVYSFTSLEVYLRSKYYSCAFLVFKRPCFELPIQLLQLFQKEIVMQDVRIICEAALSTHKLDYSVLHSYQKLFLLSLPPAFQMEL